jgi:hypothetical protein
MSILVYIPKRCSLSLFGELVEDARPKSEAFHTCPYLNHFCYLRFIIGFGFDD